MPKRTAKTRSPTAKSLESAKYRRRLIPSKKVYRRKGQDHAGIEATQSGRAN